MTRDLIYGCEVVCATLVGVGCESLRRLPPFPLVVIDECTQVGIPPTLPPPLPPPLPPWLPNEASNIVYHPQPGGGEHWSYGSACSTVIFCTSTNFLSRVCCTYCIVGTVLNRVLFRILYMQVLYIKQVE